MARKENIVSSTAIQVTINKSLATKIEALVHTGSFGRTHSEAIERIVSLTIDDLLRKSHETLHLGKDLLDEIKATDKTVIASEFEDFKEFKKFLKLKSNASA